jgi:hypothetical protein
LATSVSIGIVEEEADEATYWLELLVDAKMVLEPRLRPLMDELNEIFRMTVASIKTLRANNPRNPKPANPPIENLKSKI